METLLRQYTLSEFELELGDIQVQSLEGDKIMTEKGTMIILAKHLKAAIEKGIIRWDKSSIKNFYANLFEYDEYDNDGNTIKKRKWILFASDLKYSRTDNNRFILFRWYNYKRISERNNFCDLYIQTKIDGVTTFFRIDGETQIHEFTNDSTTKTYNLETNKGSFKGKYVSKSFIGAFIKIMDYPATSNDISSFKFYLYMDGRFEKSLKRITATF